MVFNKILCLPELRGWRPTGPYWQNGQEHFHMLLLQTTKMKCCWKLILLVIYVGVYTLEVHQSWLFLCLHHMESFWCLTSLYISHDAEMHLPAPLDKSSEKFAVFNVKIILSGHHCYLLNAVLIWWIFFLCVACIENCNSIWWSFCCYYKLGQREERRGKYLSIDVIRGQSTLKTREIQSQLLSI